MLRFVTASALLLALVALPGHWSASRAASPGDIFGTVEIKVVPPEPRGSYRLDQARGMYQNGRWGCAFRCYKTVHAEQSEDPRDPEVLLMIADCAERVRPELFDILSPEMGTPSYGSEVLRWLKRTYGLSIVTSEGDSGWHYDKRALREFLKRYPDHAQADKVAYVLAREDLLYRKYDEAVFMSSDDRARSCARDFAAQYEAVLKRYPKTDLRPKIELELAVLRRYVRSEGPAPEIWRG
jgi:hypothetical protein